MNKLLILIVCMIVSFGAFAQVITPEMVEKDAVAALFDVIANWKMMSPVLKASAIISFLTYIFVKFLPEKLQFKRLIVTALGVASGIVMSMANGTIWWKAVIVGLISSGGAVAIYEAFKGMKKVVSK